MSEQEQYLEIFEDLSKQNDITYWLASDVMSLLGYENESTFKKVITRAQGACANSDVAVHENFISVEREDGKHDIKLSRFACFLVAMSADFRKPEVAKIQTYLAQLADAVQNTIELSDNIPRVPLRGEIKEREKALASTANNAGVFNFARFQAAGYLGMYNMNITRLKQVRGIPKGKSPLDFMGKTELAANLFRITQTEERIKTRDIKGQTNCERVSHWVGKQVRDTMKELGEVYPEDLPIAEDIKHVTSSLRKHKRKLSKADPKLPLGDEDLNE